MQDFFHQQDLMAKPINDSWWCSKLFWRMGFWSTKTDSENKTKQNKKNMKMKELRMACIHQNPGIYKMHGIWTNFLITSAICLAFKSHATQLKRMGIPEATTQPWLIPLMESLKIPLSKRLLLQKRIGLRMVGWCRKVEKESETQKYSPP